MMMTRVALSMLGATIMSCGIGPGVAAELTPPPPAVENAAPAPAPIPAWVGYAVSSTGRVFSEESAEEQRARVFARHECARATGVGCRAIAVPKAWRVSAVLCGGGGFASDVPTGSALSLARQKALVAGVRVPCRQVFSR